VIGFVMPDLSPLRPLATLRRLPPGPPDDPVRAIDLTLRVRDDATLEEMAGGDQKMLAAMATYVLSHRWEQANDHVRALAAARRMLELLTDDDMDLIRALAHSRVGELCLYLEPGEAAYVHLKAAVSIAERLGGSTLERGRWALVQANLQRGAYDEAERGLAETSYGRSDDPIDARRFELCARAQIQLGRGDVEGSLRLWRQAIGPLVATHDGTEFGLWPFEVEAGAVLMHARHGRLDLVEEVVDALPGILSAMVPSASPLTFPVCGSLLLALAVADADRGAGAPAARLVALAERFGVVRGLVPDLTPERVTDIGRQADGPAYADAVSTYAGLDQEGLRAAALAALRSGHRIPAE